MEVGEKDPTRRASDDTRGRIDQLAGGWDLGERPAAEVDAAPPPPAPRPGSPTRPPPVPPRRERPSAPPPPPAAPAAPPAAVTAAAPAGIVIGDDDATDADRDATRVDPRGDA